MKSSLFFHIDSPITYIETLEDDLLGILCADSQLYLIDKNTQSIFAQYNINRISLKPNCAKLSKNALYFAYVQEHPNQLNVIDLASQKLLHSISTHRHEVEIVQFDSKSKYIVAGTKTGRVFLWSASSSSHIARLSSFPEYSNNMLPPKENFVSIIEAFNDLCITSGYGGSIVITNLQTQFNTKRIHSNFAKVTALCMIDKHSLICSSRDGALQRITIKENVEHHSVTTSIREVSQIFLLSDKKHILLNNKTSQLALLDAKNLKTVDISYISTSSIIEYINIDEKDTLFVALNNGQVLQYNLKPLEEFEKLIALGSYTKAYELANSSIILKSSESFKALERKFLETYHQAQEALLHDHKVFAHSLLKEFVQVPSKAKVIHNLFYAMQHYPRLSYLLSVKRYAAAYTLVETYQPLQLTPSYKQMQKHFESAFGIAQKAIIQKDHQKAKAVLAPFATVAQKSPLIHLITNSPSSILNFSSAIHKKEYKSINSLASSYPALKTLTSYTNFEIDCDTYIENLVFNVKENEIEEAEHNLEEIQKIPRFSTQVKNLENFIKESKRFYKHYQNKNFLQCFITIDRADSIAILPLVQELNEEWTDLILDCEELALKGDIQSIKSILLDLIHLQTRETKLANIFRIAYQIQLENGLNKYQLEELTIGFENYLNIFGIDTELLDLMTQAEEKGFTLKLKKSLYIRKPRNSWFIYKEALPDFIFAKV